MREGAIGSEFDHERVVVFRDAEAGVAGVIAIHSTVLGPAMGGLRLNAYPTLEAAMLDALRLSRAMSLKNAAAGLDLGGGKAVVIDDGRWGTPDREKRMRAVGRAIAELGGSYITAEDVGTSPADMDAIAAVTSHVAGRSCERGGSGNPSPYTARTVFAAIESAVRVRLDRPGLEGVRVGVQGVGQVGARLVGLLADAGAIVSVADLDAERAIAVAGAYGATAQPLEGFLEQDVEVLAPCALGGAIDAATVPRLRAPVVAGAANNPLADAEVATLLAERGILYVPDFVANCGGIIDVGAEALGLPEARRDELLEEAFRRTHRLLGEAASKKRMPIELAEDLALRRIDGRC
jgi:glutamate dehydrogenase/leucine dehydrogenase